uniref:Uncharacterized protein n=1 Tax=Peronospora matthiolae TaxID=2874970 RepID=A0AAV1T667_9STRA
MNSLDEQQQLILTQGESNRRLAQMVATLDHQRDYVLTSFSVEERLRQADGQSLATRIFGHRPKSPEEVASGQALR